MKKKESSTHYRVGQKLLFLTKMINSDIWHFRYCTVTVSQHVDGQGLTAPYSSNKISNIHLNLPIINNFRFKSPYKDKGNQGSFTFYFDRYLYHYFSLLNPY